MDEEIVKKHEEIVKRHEEIAGAKLQEIKAKKAKDEGKKEEPKDASPESSTEKPKIEGTKDDLASKAEVEAKKDEEILSKPETDLSEEEKTRKTELVEKRESKKTPEEKLKEFQRNTQQRIDELSSKFKNLEHTSAEEKAIHEKKIAELESKLAESKKKDDEPNERELEFKAEQERVSKYTDEDKDLPLERRREMTKEELNDWLLDDYTAAQEWLSERTLRRSGEKSYYRSEQEDDKTKKGLTKEQAKSAEIVGKKHPELNTDPREKELIAKGMSDKEVFETLCKENTKYKTLIEVIKANPGLRGKPNTPELLMAEMEKVLEKKPPKKEEKEEETQDERDTRIREEGAEAERQRQADLDEGVDSSNGKPKKSDDHLSDFEKRQIKIASKANISRDRLKEIKKRRNSIPGANIAEPVEER